MSDFFEILIEIGKFFGSVLVGFIVIILFIVGVSKAGNLMDKRECYEIYATDNVILKKCKKYFEVKDEIQN